MLINFVFDLWPAFPMCLLAGLLYGLILGCLAFRDGHPVMLMTFVQACVTALAICWYCVHYGHSAWVPGYELAFLVPLVLASGTILALRFLLARTREAGEHIADLENESNRMSEHIQYLEALLHWNQIENPRGSYPFQD